MKYILFIIISFNYLFSDAHIFVYHRFGDSRYPTTNTTLKQLEEQFQYLQKNNYKVVSIEKIIEKVKNREKIPSNWVGLAIDDSYKSFYNNAFSIFKKYNYPFSLYVYVEATDKNYKDFMSWEQIKEVSNYASIGLHSYSHKKMPTLSAQEIYQDTKKAYDLFTKKLHFKPKTYVHPYGEYDKKVLKELEKFNFEAIFNQNIGSINKNSDLNDINRIPFVGQVNIKDKLKYKTLDVIWEEPLVFPKDGLLKRIKAQVNPKYKKIYLYITKEGWREIKVKNGIIDAEINILLKKNRTRLILSPDYYTISNKLIINNK